MLALPNALAKETCPFSTTATETLGAPLLRSAGSMSAESRSPVRAGSCAAATKHAQKRITAGTKARGVIGRPIIGHPLTGRAAVAGIRNGRSYGSTVNE